MTGARRIATAVAGASAAGLGTYLGLVSGAVPLDLGVGRRIRPLGPLSVDVGAGPDAVMEVIAAPYLGRATHAMREKVHVLERGSDMVLAAHRTPIRGGLRAVTVETVRFTGVERVEFRLVRGPVPHVVETFLLSPHGGGTRLEYSGEMGTDLWRAGQVWARVVATHWERAVADTLAAVKLEAERTAGGSGPG